MKGKVEVFAIASDGSETLVAQGDNLVVNGAGESIVSMLTTPSSVLGVTPRVMDTSNWRLGALSYGPAGGSFSGNAYFFPKDKVYMKTDNLCQGVSANVTSLIDQISTDKVMRILWASSTIGVANGASLSSYTPPYRLPSYPDPLDQKLEEASTSYSIVSGDGTQSFGQFENRIQFNSTAASSYFQGVFPRSATRETSAMLVSSYEGDFQANASANMIVFDDEENTSRSLFNSLQYMDYRGFHTILYNGVQLGSQPAPSIGGASVSGLGTPSVLTDFVQNPLVTITTKISPADVWAMNNYGGLHQIGLWTIDCPKALQNNQPPFFESSDSGNVFINPTTGVTKQEFKLFAKKSFTDNLCTIYDSGSNAGFKNHQTLKIQWTLDLRSQHD
jgi:hypothetical protein